MNDQNNANQESGAITAEISRRQPVAFPEQNLSENGHHYNGQTKGASSNGHANSGPQFGPGDAWPFVDALGRRWWWPVISGILLALGGLVVGMLVWKPSYTANASLIRYDSPNTSAVLGQQYLAMETFVGLLRAPELMQRVADRAAPLTTAEALAKKLQITPERNSDVVNLAVSAPNRQDAVDLANFYAREAVRFTQERQSNHAADVFRFVSQQLTPIESEISALKLTPKPVVRRSVTPQQVVATKPSMLKDKLDNARVELADLLSRFTDKHPLVREQRARVSVIEGQLLEIPAPAPIVATNAPVEVADVPGEVDPETGITEGSDTIFIRSKLQSLETARMALVEKKQAAVTIEANPPGSCQLLAEATPKDVLVHDAKPKVIALSVIAGLLGIVLAGGLILFLEVMDDRLKTAEDISRVTKLPVIASAGDLGKLSEAEQKRWAFRAWTSLQGRLSPSPNHGLVCGITSSDRGEGRSTWVHLLAEAASKRGFRVLTIVARPPEDGEVEEGGPMNNPDSVMDDLGGEPLNDHATEPVAAAPMNGSFSTEVSTKTAEPKPGSALVSNVLNSPSEVTQRLVGPNSQPVVQIPLPGWVWNLERRKQWQAALRHWSQIDNIAILVELPPASMPEAVLLAENLPNLVWLADGNKAEAAETREQLKTLRDAKCHLAGAVMNRAPKSLLKNSFPRWFGSAALLVGLFAAVGPARAQVRVADSPNFAVNTNLSFSVVNPTQRAAWQQRLTLGPGDVMTISLFGEPALTRLDVAIGPDGRVSFAEAQDVLATGLTIDELRGKLDEELGKYRRAPQTMITPVAFRSKKYYMLGKVMTKGVYVLDRPITVLEAVARAHGFENGLVERNIIDIADFSRSFVMRNGRRIPLNFEKLFQDGDLSQNFAIEPDDYLYFPSTNVKEVYVVGEVRAPGAVIYRQDLTVAGAIAARAGFNDRAYKSKVLVVRGSMNQPEKFVVDMMAVVGARAPDFKLQPKDIVFVNYRPVIKLEEWGDLALTAFIQSLTTGWVGTELIKPFQE